MDSLFLLPDLVDVSADGVRLWYAATAKVERAFDLVSAVRSTSQLYLDHRFLNAATAAESYHAARFDRRTMPKEAWNTIVSAAAGAAGTAELAEQVRSRMALMNRPSLRDRIQDLINRGAGSLRSLLPDPDGVATRATHLRNDLAHGGSSNGRNRELFDTTDELLLVLEFHFLREVGFSAAAAADRLKAASRSFSGLWLRRREEQARLQTPPDAQDMPAAGTSPD